MPPPSGAPSGINPVSIGIAAVKTGFDIVRTISADAKMKKLLAQRKAYQTPEEIYKMLELSLSQAGGDTITRDFQTNQLDQDFSSIAGDATRLGANPNDLSALFDKKIQGLMKVGEQFHASNMEGMSKVLSAYDIVASNKAAEQKSQQDILKDKIAAAAGEKAAGGMGLVNDANAFIGLSAAGKIGDLYKQIADALAELKKRPSSGGGVDTTEK
jgi:hypothetical protein